MSTNQAMDRLLQTQIIDPKGKFTLEWHRWFRDIDAKVRPVLTILGQISSNTTVQGQPGTLAQKTQNINTSGQVTAPGVGFTVDAVPDGIARVAVTPTQRTGATHASIALDNNSRLVNTSRLTMNNASCTPVGGNPITSTTGVPVNAATVNVASFVMQFPFGTVSYNSGSITPLLDSTRYFITANDPTFSGGSVTYSASVNNPDVTGNEGLIYIGTVTTPAHGGGGTGGSGGGGGPCFSPNALIRTADGVLPISKIQVGDSVMTLCGPRKVQAVLWHKYAGMMHEMGNDELVTPEHRIFDSGKWFPAREFWHKLRVYEGNVLNLHVKAIGEDPDDVQRNYLLSTGWFAHNLQKF